MVWDKNTASDVMNINVQTFHLHLITSSSPSFWIKLTAPAWGCTERQYVCVTVEMCSLKAASFLLHAQIWWAQQPPTGIFGIRITVWHRKCCGSECAKEPVSHNTKHQQLSQIHFVILNHLSHCISVSVQKTRSVKVFFPAPSSFCVYKVNKFRIMKTFSVESICYRLKLYICLWFVYRKLQEKYWTVYTHVCPDSYGINSKDFEGIQ